MTDGSSPSPLGADEVRDAVLPTRRGGYDQGAVDDFLDEVADELSRQVEQRTLTARSVAAHAFRTVGLRSGYAEQDVDELLARVEERLRSDEAAAATPDAARRGSTTDPGPSTSGPAALPDVPAGGSETTSGDGEATPTRAAWPGRVSGRLRRRGR